VDDAPVPAQEVQRRIRGNPRQPVRRFLLVLELLLPLQSFDERLLCQILRIGHIPHNAVDLDKNPAEMIGDKPILPLGFFGDPRLGDFTHRIAILDGHGA
jgi:hypothetical protein